MKDVKYKVTTYSKLEKQPPLLTIIEELQSINKKMDSIIDFIILYCKNRDQAEQTPESSSPVVEVQD